ncbi:MAG: PQQ-binding-like beta-propeller repeat protein [Dehalococcoidia bacterium]|nr:PQQ-binding-like beta-propeller repeat protein [Dehalococcoidia bacterium]
MTVVVTSVIACSSDGEGPSLTASPAVVSTIAPDQTTPLVPTSAPTPPPAGVPTIAPGQTTPIAPTPEPSCSRVPGSSDIAAAPPEVARNATLWPLPNKDYAGTRSSFDSRITSETVGDLEPAWEFDFPESTAWGAVASSPLVMDEIVYVQDLSSNIYAFDFCSGEMLWERAGEGPSLAPNGLAVGWGKVFAASSAADFVALDSSTGDLLWRAPIELTSTEGIDIQPVVYDGLVYLSTAPRSEEGLYQGNATGIIYALEQETGRIKWEFNTVDSEDIWGNREVNSGGGAWFPVSIDTDRGMTYWGIGNPAPFPGTEEFPNGSSRPGPNLYTDSMVALDHETGELEWYNQVRPHDLFDMDFHISPILVTTEIDGVARDVALGAGKTGTVHAFDADTGEEYWVTEVGIHLNDDTMEIPPGESVTVYPGLLGGVETHMAYADGMVYVPVINSPATFTSTSGKLGSGRAGSVVAIDVKDGSIRWETEFDSWVLGSATIVNDLVLTAAGQTVYWFDRANGDIVGSVEVSAWVNAPLVAAGDTIIIPAGFPLAPGQKPQLIVLRLPD